MVFESIIQPPRALHKPWELFFIGILYSSAALIISHYVFGEDASLVLVFLTSLAAAPLVYITIRNEERKDFIIEGERAILKEHAHVLSFLMFFFVGVVVSLSAWFLLLPAEVSSTLFATQLRDIARIEQYSSAVTGYAVYPVFKALSAVIFHNFRVLLIALLFSFFYGVGAVFILTWNASVIAAAVGSYVIEKFTSATLLGIPLGLSRYLIHGIPEMLAYFIAGLAGGILSVAIIRHDLEPEKTKIVLKDAGALVALACAVLIFAALVEVFVTPLFFSS